MRLLLAPGRPWALLALSDALAIVVFTTVGLISHRHGLRPGGYASDALPLLAGWFGAALAFGTYRKRTARALLATWIVGVPLGVLIRALALRRTLDGKEAAFLTVALVFTGIFVLAFRAAVSLAAGRSTVQ